MNKSCFKLRRLALAVAATGTLTLAGIGVSNAGNGTANLAIQAAVSANCTVSTTTLNFGSYDPVVANATTALTGTGGVTIACTKGSAPTIGLGLGSNAVGSVRNMTNGTDKLTYELYFPPTTTPATPCGSLSTVWGTTGTGLFTPTVPASKAARSYNVCGTIAGGQDVGTGSYVDTVVATVNF